MPQPNPATITGKTGPGVQVTAKSYTNILSFACDLNNGVLTGVDAALGRFEYSLTGVTTFTVVIAAGLYTLTIS